MTQVPAATHSQSSPRPTLIFLLGLFLLAFLLRLLPPVLWPSITQADEIFQAVEQGHRLVFGYGLVPWEFDYGARSWLLAYLSAGPMGIAKYFNAGPELYLPLIAGQLAILGALTTLCAFFWGHRQYGFYGGLAVALVSTLWVDNIHFGGRNFGEMIGGHLLILSAFVSFPGYAHHSKWRYLGAGLLAGAALMMRIHLAPALLLLWFWRGFDRQRFVFLSLGALITITLNGAFDAYTWAAPFEPLWRNIQFNVLMDGAAKAFGAHAWWEYFYQMGVQWGGTIGPFLALAFFGARRHWLLFTMALVVFFSHMLISHKEYRFILPSIQIFAILAGFGLVELSRLLINGWRSTGKIISSKMVIASLGAAWLLLCIVNYVGRDYETYRDRVHDNLVTMLRVSKMPNVCGIGLYRIGTYESGGYSYLHRPIPMFWSDSSVNPDKVFEDQAGFNLFMAPQLDKKRIPAPYVKESCYYKTCIYIRPGGCETLKLKRPAIEALTPETTRPYPYVSGIN